jgi:Amt family ammonium transporter
MSFDPVEAYYNTSVAIEALQSAQHALEVGLEVEWVTFGVALVVMMQAGFTMLEVGSVSKKNTLNILTKNVVDALTGAVVWYAWGHVFAFMEGNEFIGYENGYFLKNKRAIDDYNDPTDVYSGTYYINWTFAWAFAATSSTIVSGAVAERCTFIGYLVYSIFITGFLYPVVAHWAWGPGGAFRSFDSLDGLGVIDFAGSGVVHMVGGTAALVGIIFLGPRKGRFDPQTGLPNRMEAQSPVFQVLGTFLLWVGWYGFNGVSTYFLVRDGSAANAAVAAKVSMTTTLGGAFGGMVCLALSRFVDGIIDPGCICNGILAGFVGVTASCATIEPEGAMWIGIIAALLYFGAAKLLLKLQIDDVVNAVPVHLVGGCWGIIAVGLFSSQNSMAVAYGGGTDASCGVFYGCNKGDDQLAVQIAFACAVLAYVGAGSCLVFGLLKAAGILRVSADVEALGLDESEHGGEGEGNSSPKVELASLDSIELPSASNPAEQTV